MAEKKSLLREMMDLAAATKAVDYASFRRHLPIAYLLETHGFPVSEGNSGGLKGNCPFHQVDGADHNQTFTVFGESLERFSCWSCSAQGDAVDLLKHFEPALSPDGKDSRLVFERVQELIAEVVESGWTGPTQGAKHEPFNLFESQEIVKGAQADPNLGRIQEFIDYKREQRGARAWPYDPEYLVNEWGIGTYGSFLIIPYYVTDGSLLAHKTWSRPSNARFSAKNASYAGHFYGEWRQNTDLTPLIVEGESDAWYAHYWKGEEFRVLGVATGAKTTPTAEMIEQFRDRLVYLAFDGDDAGRMALKRWSDALKIVDADVRVLGIPEGKDLSTGSDIDLLITEARPMVEAPEGLHETPEGYTKDEKNRTVAVSNFTFTPTRSLRGDGVRAFEGVLRPGKQKAVLLATDLDSKSRIKAWASDQGRTWFGEERDAAILKGMLQAKEVLLPSGELVTTAGLHNGTFVWPGGRVGPRDLTYSPPVADGHLEKKLRIYRRPWSTDIVHLMRSIQSRKITDPFLSWLATAPVRSHFPKYPFVGVTGGHGAGKTETSMLLIRAFSGSEILASFLSKQHGMRTLVSATNADVVQLEEMRKDSNRDTLEYGRNMLRNAYNMLPDEIGGRGAKNFAETTSIFPSAPIVVTGEDELSEGSHLDRMIPLYIDRKEQRPAEFAALQEQTLNGFAYAYRSWLVDKIASGEITNPIDITPPVIPGVPGRQGYNIGLLMFGWSLLQQFMADHGDDLDAPDFTGVIERLKSSSKRTPIEEAIFWSIGQASAQSFCRRQQEDPTNPESPYVVYVQVEEFVSFITHPIRRDNFPLPGNAHSIRSYMLDRLEAREYRDKNLREYMVIPLRLVLPNR